MIAQSYKLAQRRVHAGVAFFVSAFGLWTLACHATVALQTPAWVLSIALWAALGGGVAIAANQRLSEPPIGRGEVAALCALGAAGAIVFLFSHRPDADDSFYLSIAADAYTHPDSPPLYADTMYGGRALPLLAAIYRTHSIELLSATLARVFAAEPIVYAHIVIPVLFAVLAPFAWSTMLREVLPDRWLAGVLLVFLLLLALGEVHRAWGNFAYVRLYQGKAVLVTVYVPLIYGLAWRFLTEGGWRAWLMLLLAVAGALGASSTALLIAPGALALAILVRWEWRSSARAVVAFLPAGYPVLLALLLREPSHTALGFLYKQSAPALGDVVLQVFGPTQGWVCAGLIVVSWAAPSAARERRTLALMVLIFAVAALNPWSLGFVAQSVTTPDALFRIFWIIPVPILCACGMLASARIVTERVIPFSSPRAASAITAAVVLLFLLPGNTLRSKNGTDIRSPSLKVPADEYRAALALAAATPAGKAALAPEPVGLWLPTIPNHPSLLLGRLHYVNALREHFPDKISDRIAVERVLRGGGGEVFRSDDTTKALTRLIELQNLGAVVLPRAAPPQSALRLIELGFWNEAQTEKYLIFTLR